MRELQVVQLKGEIVQTLQNSTQSLGKHWKILKYQEYVTLIVPHWRAYDKGKIWYPNRTWTYDLPHQYWEWTLTTVKTIHLHRWIGCTNYATSTQQSRTLNLVHTTLVPAFLLSMLFCNGFSAELSNFETNIERERQKDVEENLATL